MREESQYEKMNNDERRNVRRVWREHGRDGTLYSKNGYFFSRKNITTRTFYKSQLKLFK